MANPRKFSEKIALHNQKQAEETAAFEKIMQEVSAATSRVNSSVKQVASNSPQETASTESTLRPTQPALGSYRSGSLPNVAAPQAANVEPEITKPEETSLSPQFGVGPPSPARSPGQRGRTSSSGGPMRRPAERKHDTSPYGSTAYLSPPDSSWRRTNSDSALHQSCGEQPPAALSPHHPHHSHAHPHQPHQSRRNEVHLDVFNNMPVNPNIRPRSSCEIPRIPNNTNMYETVGGLGGTLSCDHQMPGGSLPDLTSVHYPPPHPAYQPHSRGHYHHPGQGGPGTGPGPGAGSPATGGLSPASGSPVGATVPPPLDALHTALRQDPSLYDTQNRLSVPNTNNYLHQNKNISPLEQSWISSSYQSNCSPPSQYSSSSNINIPSPTIVHSPGSPADQQPQTDYSNYHLIDQFEQITMDWAQLVQSLVDSGWTAHVQLADNMDPPTTQNTQFSTSYINHSSPHSPQTTNSPHTYSQSPHRSSPNLSGNGVGDMSSIHDPSECRSRQGRDPLSGGNYPALQPLTSPATPASIPDIVIGDYSGDLDAGIFCGEESELRAGLDLDELTLLEEPNSLLPDSAVEHEFRAEHEYLGGL